MPTKGKVKVKSHFCYGLCPLPVQPTTMARRLSPSRTIIASFGAQHHQSSPASPAVGGGQQQQQQIVNDFDEGLYILQLASGPCSSGSSGIPSPPTAPLSCSLSNKSVQTYDKRTHTLVHTISRAHSGPITDICHTNIDGNIVVTSGQDGLVRLFDLRQSSSNSNNNNNNSLSRAAAEMCLPRKEEALSVSIGYGGALAAVGGSRGLVHFYDLRSIGGGSGGKPNLLGTYEDAHTEEVTRVRFQPNPDLSGTTTNLLVTSSEDGLVCTHGTAQPNEEAALSSVLNIGTPLREVGFFGPACEGLYCLTGSETISVWHHDSAQRICDFGDVRNNLSNSAGLSIEYLVGCNWDGNDLSLLAGNSDGGAAIFRVDAGRMTLSHTLAGGHKGCVRGLAVSRDDMRLRVLVTGGEDARLCEWNLDGQRAVAVVPATSPLPSPSNRLAGGSNAPRAGGGPLKHTRKKNTSAPY